MYITSEQDLRRLYAAPSLGAITNAKSQLDKRALAFIEQSTLILLASADASGEMDISPRGGVPGFVRVVDNKTLIIPDAPGNNRLDSLENILENNEVSCLFLAPNKDQTLRVSGRAAISVAEPHLSLDFGLQQRPLTCLEILVTEVFLHCSKSLRRAGIWST